MIGSLFSGAGGLDMAVQAVFGGDIAWHSEVDPAASKVLAHRFPGVPNLGDITQVDWAAVEPVDVLCGGFPCQDVSLAGRRAGLKNGTRTGLFAHIMTAIEALRPRLVVLENVIGLLTADGDEWPDEVHALNREANRWGRIVRLINRKMAKAERKGNRDRQWWHRKHAEAFRASRRLKLAVARFQRERYRLVPRAIATVLRSLAEAGYDAQWCSVRASDVGAPHRRERLFILATAADARDGAGHGERSRPQFGQGSEDAADTASRAWSVGHGDDVRAGRGPRRQPPTARRSADADTPRDGRNEGRPEPARLVGRPDAALSGDGPVELLPTPSCADGGGGHLTRSGDRGGELLLPGVARAYATGDLLPTPTATDFRRNDSPGELARTTPNLGAINHYLPTPAAADGQRGQDFARAGRDGSGGDDLVTQTVKATRDQQWGKYQPAIERWETLTRPAPSPTEPNSRGNPRLSAAFSEWMQGWPAGWVTDPAIGISRNDQLRCIGNGVVPQQAIAALAWLLEVTHLREAIA